MSRWEWAVNWLKSKMEGNYWTDSVLSNEDSNNRTFHRYLTVLYIRGVHKQVKFCYENDMW